MVDSVTTQVISNNGLRYEVIFTNVSDGTGESSVRKVDLSNLKYIGTDHPPSALDVEHIEANIDGFESVTLAWDRNPSDIKIAVLPKGQTLLYFNRYLPDPQRKQQGSTGDIILTTNGSATSQDAYVIKVRFRLRK